MNKDYLKEGDGFVDITLAREVTVAGAKLAQLRMREPTVRDLEASQSRGGTEAEQEVAMFANLLEIAPDDVRGLSLKNYIRVQAAFRLFTS